VVSEALQPVACGKLYRYLPDSVYSVLRVSDKRYKTALIDDTEGKLRNSVGL